MRRRFYASNAERQKAYRARITTGQSAPSPPPPTRPRRGPSRPARLTRLLSEVQDLLFEYERWLESLPDTLKETDQGTRLAETCEQLTAVADLLAEVDPPKGFGRD